MNLLLIISEEGCAGLMAVREILRKGILVLLGRVTRKYPHLVLIPALSSGRVLVLNSGTRPGTTVQSYIVTT